MLANITILRMNSLLSAALIKIVISMALYFIAFLPTNYYPDLLRNNEYSTFFYLPTGMKVLCVLLFDIWGAIGVAIGVFIRQSLQHPDLSFSFPLSLAFENLFVFWVTVKVSLKSMGVGREIQNITYIKIVGIALMCSVLHGFSYAFVLLEFSLISPADYFRESLFTAMSGLFGTMAIVLLLSLAFKHSLWLQKQVRAIEND
jgi:hypothetical protein